MQILKYLINYENNFSHLIINYNKIIISYTHDHQTNDKINDYHIILYHVSIQLYIFSNISIVFINFN